MLTPFYSIRLKNIILQDPRCDLFPTEVSCNFKQGSSGGAVDTYSYLCILQNNVINQTLFIVLWVWWLFSLCFSVLQSFHRVVCALCPCYGLPIPIKKVFHGITLTTAEVCIIFLVAKATKPLG